MAKIKDFGKQLANKAKGFLNGPDDDDDYEDSYYEDDNTSDNDYSDEIEMEEIGYSRNPYNGDTENFTDSYLSEEYETRVREIPSSSKPLRPSISPSMTPVSLDNGVAVTTKVHCSIYKPQSFDQVGVIADDYKKNRIVHLNLQDIPKTEAFRIIDFMAGLLFYNKGTIKRIGTDVYLLAPPEVTVDANTVKDISKQSGT